nr:tripartite tricarboxylate transporter permease [Variovorax paradoxus]
MEVFTPGTRSAEGNSARQPALSAHRRACGLPAVRTGAGPLLFVTNADLVWGLIASFFIGNLMLLVLNLPLVGLWVRLLKCRSRGCMRASWSSR